MRFLFTILLSIIIANSYCQQPMDSLWGVWNNAEQHDSTRLSAINTVIRTSLLFTNPDSAFKLANSQYEFANKVGSQKWRAAARNTQGVACHIQGDYYRAITFYNKGLIIAEEIGELKTVASSLNNIGIVYKEIVDYEKALVYFKKSYKIKKEIGDKMGMANTLGNIGGIHAAKKEDDLAIDYYNRGLRIMEELGNKRAVSSFLNNIGEIHKNNKDYDKAKEKLARALELKIEVNDKRGQSSSLNKIGNLFIETGEIEKSIPYNKRAYEIAKEIGVLAESMEAAKGLYIGYKETGKADEALVMLEEYIMSRDSINSKRSQQEIIRQEYEYEYDKQKAIDDKEHEKQLAIKAEQGKKQRVVIYATVFGLLLVVIFSVFIYKRLQVTRKQKLVIESQNKEILDSIAYAKRIQNAILPPDKLVKEYLQDSFIIYKPKDIVAGDFYWMEHKDGKVLFAAADCTGHGVPGAMVSVICNNGLNRSVREHGLTDPGKILDRTREIVIQEFEKSEEEVKDGMDIALCSLRLNVQGSKLKDETLNPKPETAALLQYAGAHNPLWLIRNGELIEYKADKQPIGKYRAEEPYNTHTIELSKGDTIYIFSDGFVDQFGGDKGKKYMTGNFKKLLTSIQHETMENQKRILEDTFESWRGKLEQLDDVCVIGVRV